MRNHEEFIDAAHFNLLFWQVAGMNVISPRAMALLDAAGAILLAGEAWDPDAAFAPTPARPSTGVYTLTYAAQYPNEDGTLITLDLKGAIAIAQGSTANIVGVCEVTNNNVVTARMTTANTGAAVNTGLLVVAF